MRLHLRLVLMAAALVAPACGGSSVASSAFDEPGDAASGDAGSDASAGDTNADAVVSDGASDANKPDAKPDTPAPGCPGGKVSSASECPSVCTGGCDGETCRIDCSGISSCGGTTIVCPPNKRCQVNCGGISSCGGTEVQCSDDAPCAVTCNGTSSCGNIRVKCPGTGGSCGIGCLATSSCGGGEIDCGPGACLAQCTGTGAKMSKVDCASSCSCKNEGC